MVLLDAKLLRYHDHGDGCPQPGMGVQEGEIGSEQACSLPISS